MVDLGLEAARRWSRRRPQRQAGIASPNAPTSGDAVGVCGCRDSVGGRGAAAEKRSGAARVGERRKPAVEWAVGYLLAG